MTDDGQLTRDIAELAPTSSTIIVQQDVTTTQAAIQRAQHLVGSVGSPADHSALAAQVDAALESEKAWLDAVATVLRDTESPVLSQISDLGSLAQSRFQDLSGPLPVMGFAQLPFSTQLVAFISGENDAALATLATGEFSRQVMALLDQSSSSDQSLVSLYEQLDELTKGEVVDLTIAVAEQDLNDAMANRSALSAAALAISSPTPATQAVRADLAKVFTDDLTSDSDLAHCLDQKSTQTISSVYQTCVSAMSGDFATATADQQAFTTAYNQLEAGLGQPPVTIHF